MTKDFVARLQNLVNRLERYGYSDIRHVKVIISLGGAITASAYLEDDFQESADFSDRVQVGFFTFYLENDRFPIPEDFKTREERELHFMARRLGNTKELANQMVSAAGRAFALRLEEELSSLRTMITGPRKESF